MTRKSSPEDNNRTWGSLPRPYHSTGLLTVSGKVHFYRCQEFELDWAMVWVSKNGCRVRDHFGISFSSHTVDESSAFSPMIALASWLIEPTAVSTFRLITNLKMILFFSFFFFFNNITSLPVIVLMQWVLNVTYLPISNDLFSSFEIYMRRPGGCAIPLRKMAFERGETQRTGITVMGDSRLLKFQIILKCWSRLYVTICFHLQGARRAHFQKKKIGKVMLLPSDVWKVCKGANTIFMRLSFTNTATCYARED